MSRAYAAVLVVPLVVALAILVAGGNVPLFRALQSASRIVPPVLFEAFWQSATYAGDGLAVFALATVLLARRPDAAWAGMIAAIPGSLVLQGLKALVPYDRPALVLMNDGVTVMGPVLQHGSFPSGHSVAAGILGGIVFLAYRSAPVRAAGLLVMILIGLSRAAVGVHWPIDIAVGLAAGWACAWIGWQAAGEQPWASTPRAQVAASAILGACAIGLLFHPMGLPAATSFRVALALAGALLALFAAQQGWVAQRAPAATRGAAVRDFAPVYAGATPDRAATTLEKRMGLIDFVKEAGEKLFGHGQAEAASPAATGGSDAANSGAADAILNYVKTQNLSATGLTITYDGASSTVTVYGVAPDQATREKIVLCCGNVAGVSGVKDMMSVDQSAPEGKYYTVVSGDTLSKISKQQYGDANQYMKIFEANKPMLSNPDKIYPGQKLRIPPA